MDQIGGKFFKVSLGNEGEMVELLAERLQLLLTVRQRLHQEVKERLSRGGICSKTSFDHNLIIYTDL